MNDITIGIAGAAGDGEFKPPNQWRPMGSSVSFSLTIAVWASSSSKSLNPIASGWIN